ncbi:MAG: SpoIIIAH-like family protein [Bacillota bacterium]|nr:SpoIIIAH-like family protein [Bacillota bacterium]
MKSRKSIFSFIKNNKKKVSLLAALMICLGVYTAIGGIFPDEAANDDIPLHDGDVLVDSLNVDDGENKAEGKSDSELVTSDDVSELENTDTYFQELRATLDMDRNKIISMLSESESSASTKAEKEEATAEKMKLLTYMEQEKTVETLIKNKGLPETFVVITDSGVNVTVNTKELDQAMVTKICDILMRETGRKASEIVVQDVS